MKKSIGSVELITFRTTRNHHPYIIPLSAIAQGISSGHISLRLKFSDTDLFNQYIKDNNKIPHKIKINAQTGEYEYEVYVSFWPHGEYAPWTESSKLEDYKTDCEISASYSPVEYSPEVVERFQPMQRAVSSSLPVLRELFSSVIQLPPTIILHTSRLGMAFGDQQNLIPNQAVMDAAERFCVRYHDWKAAGVLEHNFKLLHETNANQMAAYKRTTKIALHRLQISQRQLKELMFPGQELSSSEFLDKLEPFVTFGYPERDSILLPISNYDDTAGLELEPMLAYIKHIADNPKEHPYHVLRTNCSQIIMDIIWHGGKDCKYHKVREEFQLPWYVRNLGFSLTPSLVMQHVVNIQSIMTEINGKPIDYDKMMSGDYRLYYQRKTEKYRELEAKTLQLRFSNKHVAEEDDDELPTTRIAIMCKLLDNVMGNIRE
jgi:hypothetical protein